MRAICIKIAGEPQTIYVTHEQEDEIRKLKEDEKLKTLKEAYLVWKNRTGFKTRKDRWDDLTEENIRLKKVNQQLREQLRRCQGENLSEQ